MAAKENMDQCIYTQQNDKPGFSCVGKNITFVKNYRDERVHIIFYEKGGIT